MILGRIVGKSTTTNFNFLVEGDAKKFEYIQVYHKDCDYVLCQIVELERDTEKTIARCIVIGYKDSEGRMRQMREPFEPSAEVLRADDNFIREVIKLDEETKGISIGKLDGKDIDVFLDLRKLLAKHLSIIAKTGAGKSYTVGVIIEEIMEKKIPLIVIDPHGEYSTLKYPNDDEADRKMMERFKVEPKNFIKQIQEYGDINMDSQLRPLKLNSDMTGEELVHMLPAKLNNNQVALLYSALKNMDKIDFESLILELEMHDSSAKWGIISIVDYLRKLDLFSPRYTDYNELIQSGKCSIINLKGVSPEIQEIIVYKLMKDLFNERKKGTIPPFFAVVEEAHNYAPERSFGEAKSSSIMRTIASEGRKFGLGLCVVSQRPARVDKSVLSQCNTQIMLKVTNPNDLRAISTSVEGITPESEMEIRNLPVGTAMITGIVDMPLFVSIRPRKTKHGGQSVSILDEDETEEKFLEEVHEFEKKDLMPLIKPKTSLKDLQLMSEKPIKSVKTYLIPAVLLNCEGKFDFNLLVELTKGEVITDMDKGKSIPLPDFNGLSPTQLGVIQIGSEKEEFTPADLMIGMNIEFGRATDLAQGLCKKGFLEYNGKYKISSGLAFDLSKHSFYGNVEYSKADYDKKLGKKLEASAIKESVQKLANVKDIKECFIVWHDVTY